MTDDLLAKLPLGKAVTYIDTYDASLLCPIARSGQRAEIGVTSPLPFHGYDVWTAFELSWLNEKGKPNVAVAEIHIPCASENLIESKSLKLYLNSFMQTSFARQQDVVTTIKRDLSEAAGANIDVKLLSLQQVVQQGLKYPQGQSLDHLDISVDSYTFDPTLLAIESSAPVEEILTTDLFKSNCLVTGQPDWATVFIHYRGPKIEQAALLRYLISFRKHLEFHEHCVERIFTDLIQHCQSEKLTVYARFTRRGGLDINPFRSNFAGHPENIRLARQ